MSELENATVTTPEQTADQPAEQRTFTQAELDAIVSERLKRERAKYSDYEDLKAKAEASETGKDDLQKATARADDLQKKLDALEEANRARDLRERIAEETGVPAKLLRGDSENDLRAQATAIMGFAKASRPAYPNVKDGGETALPTLSKQDILGIKDEQKRLKAIRDNIELFK
jgi:hypothetical protein